MDDFTRFDFGLLIHYKIWLKITNTLPSQQLDGICKDLSLWFYSRSFENLIFDFFLWHLLKSRLTFIFAGGWSTRIERVHQVQDVEPGVQAPRLPVSWQRRVKKRWHTIPEIFYSPVFPKKVSKKLYLSSIIVWGGQ